MKIRSLSKYCRFLYSLALDVAAICICKIHCLDGFDINTVHKQSSKEKSRQSWDSNLGLLDGKQECLL